MSSFSTPDESVEDTVASLLDSDANHVLAYDDSSDRLTISLSNSVSTTSLETDSVTFNQDITDSEGNTVTDLPDPVRVTEEAVTFAESDVTVTNNNTEISSGSVALTVNEEVFPDDFEDGVDSGWSGDTGSLTTTSAPALSGGASGKYTSDGAFLKIISPSVGQITDAAGFKVQLDNQSGNSDDEVFFVFRNANADRLGQLRFVGDGNIKWLNSGGGTESTLRSWSINTTYSVSINWDFSNSEAQIDINGSNEGTYGIDSSRSSWDNIEIGNYAGSSNESTTLYMDNIGSPTSGNALVSFDSGVPNDIKSYDLATFQRTLDGETVTIDVEDSNGNVLKSDISKNTDISDITTSTDVQLRANLSRNDTSNNPTVDYLARRFTR